MIELSKIQKAYRKGDITVNALCDISFSIKRGDFTVIKGASGSGKTTLMNIIGFLDQPTGGKYLFNGEDVTGLSDNKISSLRNRKIGFVFQSFNLIHRKSSLENVMLPLFYSDKSLHNYKSLSIDKLTSVGLSHRIKHKPSELSGGEQQRVAIARALISDPDLILADEPTGNLDSRTSEEIMAIFKHLSELGKTIIIVTHEGFISGYASRIITLKDGAIISDDYRRP